MAENKNNLDWYKRQTDSYQNAKLITLRASYPSVMEGWAADGRFWALNDIIASSDECIIDLTKTRNLNVTAQKLAMQAEEFKEFIKLLLSPDIELLIEIEPGIITTKRVNSQYEKLNNIRSKDRARKTENLANNNHSDGNNKFPDGKETIPDGKLSKRREEKNRLEKKEKKSNQGVITNASIDINFLSFTERLFRSCTDIKNPHSSQLQEVAIILEEGNAPLTVEQVKEIITNQFKNIKDQGVKRPKSGFIAQSIRQRIAVEREKSIQKAESQKMREQTEELLQLHAKELNNNELSKIRAILNKGGSISAMTELDKILSMKGIATLAQIFTT